jgi:hypothetical protein
MINLITVTTLSNDKIGLHHLINKGGLNVLESKSER